MHLQSPEHGRYNAEGLSRLLEQPERQYGLSRGTCGRWPVDVQPHRALNEARVYGTATRLPSPLPHQGQLRVHPVNSRITDFLGAN